MRIKLFICWVLNPVYSIQDRIEPKNRKYQSLSRDIHKVVTNSFSELWLNKIQE